MANGTPQTPAPPPRRPPPPPPAQPVSIVGIYVPFYDEDIIANAVQRNTYGLWTGGSGSLTAFYTSSTQSGSTGKYYYDVYNIDPSASTSEKQFAVAYGHIDGGGYTSSVYGDYPTKAIYYQYRNTLLDPSDTYFTFAGSYNSNDIFVINFQRSRYKQKVDPGNWELTLTGASGSFHFIDDSNGIDDTTATIASVYNIVSGSLDVANATSSIKTAATAEPSGGVGLFYPARGIMVFNPRALVDKIGAPLTTGSATECFSTSSIYSTDNARLFLSTFQSGSSFYARSEESVNSTHYFCRAKNKANNFSTNPSFYTSSGYFRHRSMNYDPQVYITTVGLYNEGNELVAVAKLSQPYLKNFEREALIKVKLDF